MITRGHAKQLRRLIEQTAVNLTDTEALTGIELFPQWKTETAYGVGDRVQYEGHLYKCVQAHTSQDDWTPDVSVSLWSEVSDPSQEWPEWRQPQGAHDAYMQGDKVSHNNKHWISTMDNNVFEPSIYGWDEQL